MPNDPFYSTPQWRRVRAYVLERDRHACQLAYEGCTVRATAVDHIIERRDLPAGSTLHLDEQNLRAVCWSCHSRKTHRKTPAVHAPPSRVWT